MEADWRRNLEQWLARYLQGLGNKTRLGMCPAYITGLIGPGDRKSIQPMAARLDTLSYDRLHHFVGAGIRDSAPPEAMLWRQADALVGGDEAWLVIDDTALPKKGKASVGVAPQYATVPSFFMTAGQVSDYTGAASMPDDLRKAQWLPADRA